MKKEIPMLFSTPMVIALNNGSKTMTRRTKGLEKINENPDAFRFHAILCHPKGGFCARFFHIETRDPIDVKIPYGEAGDIIYVRENFKVIGWDEDGMAMIEYADGVRCEFELSDDNFKSINWMDNQMAKLVKKGIIEELEEGECCVGTGKHHPFSPSIHQPKWSTRMWILIGEIAVERLQDISEQDAINEGVLLLPSKKADDIYAYQSYAVKSGGNGVAPYVSFRTLWQSINGFASWDVNPWVWVIKFKKVKKHE